LEYAPGVTIDYIKEKTLGRLVIAEDVKEMVV
jgi:acyl CoA:acetate/3-ketoacid CoA transferase beta subunit